MKKHFEYCDDNLVIMPGFYESTLFSSDTVYEENRQIEEDCKENGEEYVEHDINDFTAFQNAVCERITDNLIAPMLMEDENLCDSVKFKEVSSPAYYNFTTDKIVLDLNIDIDYLKNLIRSDKEMYDGFNKYLKEKYTSRDGFMIFVENEIEAYFEADDYQDVMVDYYLLTKIYDDKDVVRAVKEDNDWPHYSYQMMEIASECVYEFMEPIKNEEE